ncbi:hypothetical protein [Scytonema sp. NUACC26]|uniref:hypothetical protein n=1 Tax=Scytonema sp. NUACC26 TaxID=3140176 RepID=UPI0034DB8949
MPIINSRNLQEIVDRINRNVESCWVSVFSLERFEVGYPVSPRFRACNPKTIQYDGEWVEPAEQLVKFIQEYTVCASFYVKAEFDSAVKEAGLWSSVDFNNCLDHYLGEQDADLIDCYKRIGRPLLSWEEFVNSRSKVGKPSLSSKGSPLRGAF